MAPFRDYRGKGTWVSVTESLSLAYHKEPKKGILEGRREAKRTAYALHIK